MKTETYIFWMKLPLTVATIPINVQSESEPGIYADIGKERRLVIVHGETGLVDGVLAIFKPDSKCRDYHGDIDVTNFHSLVET